MSDPVTLTTAVILGVAAQKFVESAASKAGGALTEGAMGKAGELWTAIKAKFAGKKKAETAIAAIESEGSEAALTKLEVYLEDEMDEDAGFAGEVRSLAQQVLELNIQSTQSNQQNNNYGRDQNIINQPTGDLKIGGS